MNAQPDGAIFKVGALIVQDGKLLVVRKRTADDRTEYIMPGGRKEGYETDQETIERELLEELQVRVISIEHFGSFDEIAVFENIPIHIEAYSVTISGTPVPSSEIKEYIWIDRDYAASGILLGSVLARHVVPRLSEAGHI